MRSRDDAIEQALELTIEHTYFNPIPSWYLQLSNLLPTNKASYFLIETVDMSLQTWAFTAHRIQKVFYKDMQGKQRHM